MNDCDRFLWTIATGFYERFPPISMNDCDSTGNAHFSLDESSKIKGSQDKTDKLWMVVRSYLWMITTCFYERLR